MDCRQFNEWMSLRIDRLLDPREQENFNQHMRDCKICRIEFEEYSDMVSLMQNMEDQQLPHGFHERLHKKLEQETKLAEQSVINSNKPVKWARWLGAVVAVFVLLFSLKILDSVNLGDKSQSEFDMGNKSTESADEASDLDIASIPSVNEERIKVDDEEKPQQEESERQEGPGGLKGAEKSEDPEKQYEADEPEKAQRQVNPDQQKKPKEQGEPEEQEGSAEQGGAGNHAANYNLETNGEDTDIQLRFNEAITTQDAAIQNTMRDSDGRIETDLVKVKVQDVCITPATLKMMAVNNGIDVVRSTENSVVLELTNSEHREILYDELLRLGEIEEAGDKTDSMQVTVVIVREE